MSKAKTEIIYRTVSLTVWKRLLLTLAVVSLLLSAGCSSINKELTRHIEPKDDHYNMIYGPHVYYGYLTNSMLEKMDFAGSVCNGNTEVNYQRGLEDQAYCVAAKTNALLNDVEERTGLQIPYKPKVYLIRVGRIPEIVYVDTFKISPNGEMPLPLFVEAGDESCESIVCQNMSYPAYIIHEIAEKSLKHKSRLLGDFVGQLGFIPVKISTYTRWFREGFASYAGYLAYETVRTEINSKSIYAKSKTFTNPFTSLSKMRKKLFSWSNSANELKEENNDYYNASLGLFLLIRNQFGEQAIREIILKVNTQDYLNGQDLIRVVNEVLGTDIEKLAEHFSFPRTGLETEILTAATTLNEGLDVAEGLFVNAVEPNSPFSSSTGV